MPELSRTARLDVLVEGYARMPNVAGTVTVVRDANRRIRLLVHPAKLGSWSLLVVVSIVLVAAVKAYEGRLYGSSDDATVLRVDEPPAGLRPESSRPGAHASPEEPVAAV
jgi:hypothetical protein